MTHIPSSAIAAVVAVVTLCAALVAGCGDGDGEGGAGGAGGDDAGRSASNCGSETCDFSTGYCIRSRVGAMEDVENVCAALPAGCSDCDCATADAERAWSRVHPGTNHCSSATLLCESNEGAIEVVCWRDAL